MPSEVKPGDLPDKDNEALARVLSLSWRISTSSPPMKPFIRFSPDTEELYSTVGPQQRSMFWDFDQALQKTLLNIVKAISTPEQLSQAVIKRWKSNLKSLYQKSQKELEKVVTGKKPFMYRQADRINFILARLNKSSRLLYVGCGRGTECLSIANQGHNVVGIDTNLALTETANAWAKYLGVPFEVVCMDVMDLGFTGEAFDSFLLEFYGFQSSVYQSLLLQKNLAWVLRQGKKGIIVASRKNYSSYWFLMGSTYPLLMTLWLRNQATLDYRFEKSAGPEEKLMYGLYYRSHTVDSLSQELGYAFKVMECLYEKDPRYVICIVEPRENVDSLPDPEPDRGWGGAGPKFPDSGEGSIPEVLGQIESVCNFLECHEKNVVQYFQDRLSQGKNPLQNIPLQVTAFLQLLEPVLGNSRTSGNRFAPTCHPSSGPQ